MEESVRNFQRDEEKYRKPKGFTNNPLQRFQMKKIRLLQLAIILFIKQACQNIL